MKRWLVAGVGLVAVVAIAGIGGGALYLRSQWSGYPTPRFPSYLREPQSVDELLPAARLAVRNPGGLGGLGVAQRGDRVLVLVPNGQHPMAWEAIRRAWEEVGIQADALFDYQARGLTLAEHEAETRERAPYQVTGADGWKEIGTFRREIADYLPPQVRDQIVPPPPRGVPAAIGLGRYLDAHPEYTAVFAGGGGGMRNWQRPAPQHAQKYKKNWFYSRPNDLLSKIPEFPGDLWKLAEDKVMQPIPFAAQAHATDPEGTDFSFSVTPEEARIWHDGMYTSGHMWMYPRPGLGGVFADAKGVIAGCANHTALYPCMNVYIEHGMIDRIEGGGQFGDLTRMLLEDSRLKNARYPGTPYPGYWYLFEFALGTNPKYFRPVDVLYNGGLGLINTGERTRAGVIHHGFGLAANGLPGGDGMRFAEENNLPPDHAWHVHYYFLTYQVQLRDTGERITLVDKGNLKALEDPEVRALAARYGDPELILRYEWVPAIPGINVPGDYRRDYAPDPWAYLKREIEAIRDGTYRYLIAGYPTPKGLEAAAALAPGE